MAKGKILVIDDDTDILQVVDMILRKIGFEVVIFNSPPDNFIAKVIQVKPAVILLDIQLGGYDGRELGKQVKETKKLAHIPVVLFSANHEYMNTKAEYLCDDFIDKPFELDFFINKMNYYAH